MGEDKSGPFQPPFNSSLTVNFHGARVTSDGGLIFVRKFDERPGVNELIEQRVPHRTPGARVRAPRVLRPAKSTTLALGIRAEVIDDVQDTEATARR